MWKNERYITLYNFSFDDCCSYSFDCFAFKKAEKRRHRDMIKIDYHIPLVGGVFTQVSEAFNRGALWHLSRCVKSTMQDAGVLICYE